MKAKRLKEWLLPKGGFVMGFFLFICSFFLEITKTDFNFLFGAIITFFSIGFLGYWINDWSDLKSDLVVGKSNLSYGFSTFLKLLIFLVLLGFSILPWIFLLPIDKIVIATLVVQFVLFIGYSCPPIRAKRIPILGLVLDALYANVIPVNLAFYTVCLYIKIEFSVVLFSLLAAWSFLYGLRGIIVHHYFDKENDKVSGEYNLFNSVNKSSIFKLTSLFYFLETAVRTITLWKLINFLNPMISEIENYFLIVLIVISILFTLIDLVNVFRKLPPNPFSSNLSDVFNQKVILFSFIIALLLKHYYLFPLAFLFFWWIFNLRSSFIFAHASVIINHLVYDFYWKIRRKIPFSIKRKFAANWKLTHKKKHYLLNLAIFNENQQKYTETFVQAHLNKLPFNKVLYFGNPPQNINPWGDIVSENKQWKHFKLAVLNLFGVNESSYLSKQLARSLKGRKIDVVLAEFGTMGAQIYEACELAGVPLVVVFYGYDAWHKKTIDLNILKYQEMFLYATKIVGVSQDICEQLEKLGCPKEKIEYLPCYVNLNRFQYIDHSKNPPIILSVGRFSETKSPHLTILAFNEVLKEIPDAKLVMIGKDGGGELFEACHILVRALEIADKVEFKGILTSAEVKSEMDKASVFVQHSVTTPIQGDKEGTPVAIMEAMACGLPVVATKHAGIAELIKSGEIGFLVEEYDYQSMAKQIVFCLTNQELMVEIGRNASTSIRSNELIHNHHKLLAEIIFKSNQI